MADRLEVALRAAQRRRAEDAPDPDRRRRRLPALTRRRTRTRRALIAGGVAVATAAAAAVVVLFAPSGPGPIKLPAVSPSIAASPSPVPLAPAPDVERSYVPGWLPPGLRERSRAVAVDGPTPGVRSIRIWSKEPLGSDLRRLGQGPYLMMALQPGPVTAAGTPVRIGAVTGYYHAPDDQSAAVARLTWPVDNGQAVYIQSNAATTQADLVRVASSAHLDITPLRQPLTVGWVPFGVREYTFRYGGDNAKAWTAAVSLGGSPTGATNSVPVTVAPDTDVPFGGKAVLVGPAHGRILTEEETADRNPRQCVVVALPAAGRILSVCSGISGPGGDRMPEADLIRVAASVDTTMRADTAWMG
ncbi:hypothetical protein [Dactylosporangium sp. NPDC051541]|uniref:hypothetical protein n=1 Tax=Dactylosporangium sp. NPDC051541 TaxID=3363977 RepID=UPI00378F1415